MDRKLVAWARAVKARNRRREGGYWPVLWLFTDAERLPEPLAAAARLPKGLCGVVLRHDGAPAREALGRRLARICRERRLMLLVAGDARLAVRLRAGLYLRRGRRPAPLPRLCRVLGSSAHDAAEAARAKRTGAPLVFLSPAFPTASHPEARSLGPLRWAGAARRGAGHAIALGGIGGSTIRRLPRSVCAGAAAIGALGSG